MRMIAHIARLNFALVLAAAAASVHAQTHETRFGPYVLRSSVVTTPAIAEKSAETHEVPRQGDRAILNVMVYREDDPQQTPVEALIEARTQNPAGIREEIELRPIEANDRVTYTGTFTFVPREELDFHITAQADGTDEIGTLRYRERVWIRR